MTDALAPADAAWQAVTLPPTLGIVGTVNVDESAHAFSRKVLDRAFVIELAPRALADWRPAPGPPAPLGWASSPTSPATTAPMSRAPPRPSPQADAVLVPAGLGVGYRARDEVALFALHAAQTPDAWRDADGRPVDPLDVALLAKLAPRIDGARAATRAAAYGLLGWALDGRPLDAVGAGARLDDWSALGRPPAWPDARFPRTAARLARIVEGALDDGVATFWA